MMAHHWKLSWRRRGSMYVAVIGCSLVVATVGVGALLATRIEARASEGVLDLSEARLYAQSAIDVGMWTIYNDSSWRTSNTSGAWRTNQLFGEGSYSLSVVDTVDGDLSNSKSSPVVLTGTGRLRRAQYMLQATALSQPVALKALNTCLHARGNVTVSLLKNIGVTGAPLSMNGSINGPGTVVGRVEAGSAGVLPIIVGTSQIPAAAKELPESSIVADYVSMATTIATGTFNDQVVTPSVNPWGTPNADGIYYINAATGMSIKSSRIWGTLIVKVPAGKKLLLDTTVFMHPYRAEYPTLIVDGDLEIGLTSATVNLSEAVTNVNYNAAGAQYLDSTDVDKVDSYPNEVQGLIYVKGNLTLSATSQVRGVIIVDGNVTVNGSVQLIHDPGIYENPPMGFVSYVMQIASGSWKRVVNP